MQCEEVLAIFPDFLKGILEGMHLPPDGLQELRVRVGRPLFAVAGGQEYRSWASVTRQQVGELLRYLGNYSLYAYEDELRQGFMSLPGGHRVGIAGKAVMEGYMVRTLTEISSLNIRFSHEIKGCADKVYPYLWEDKGLCHTLIVSAPGGGKTTLLRDCIRQISNGTPAHPGMTVGLVDERSELAGNYLGEAGNDLGSRTDVLDRCPKSLGMMMLIRSMAPQVVAVDEIGSRADVEALMYAMHCGCILLATVHGSNLEELKRKPAVREMIAGRLFERYLILGSGRRPGSVRAVLDVDGKLLC